MQNSDQNLISIVIPVWNEEEGIPQLHACLMRVRELLRGHGPLQFIFVDDGSTDGTQQAIQTYFAGEENSLVVTHERNRGIGAAFRSGFQAAQGSIVCTIDADCTYRPEGLKSLLDSLAEEGSDIAVASPYHPRGKVEGVPYWRLALSQCCSWFYRRIAPVKLFTYTSVFRAYRRQVVETVSFGGDGFVCAAEILVHAAVQGYRISEVPMTLHARQVGQSKMKVARTMRAHLNMMKSLAAGMMSSGVAHSSLGAVKPVAAMNPSSDQAA